MELISKKLEKNHDKSDFKCGQKSLDNYIKLTAKKDVNSDLSVCFVLEKDNKVIGYYTLSSSNEDIGDIPEDLEKKIKSRYPEVPIILIGRLAIDENYQGQGLGRLLLIDSLKRIYDTSLNIGVFAVSVDPIDDKAKEFYHKFGFISLKDSKRMILPMQTIRELFENKETN